jgi:hemerythrin-like domain-containing protein
MTKLLTQVLSKVQKLSEDTQDGAAELLRDYIDTVEQNVQLTDEQLTEVRRRRAEKNPKTITLKQLDQRLRRLGAA